MRIRPANAKGTDAGAAWTVCHCPGAQRGVDIKGGVDKVNRRVGLLEIPAGRHLVLLQHQHRLDQPRDARRGFQVADIALDRANSADAGGHIIFGISRRKRP